MINLSMLEQGCTCAKCLEKAKSNLQVARDKWNNGTREIVFIPYHNTCSDNCCDTYGTDVYANGFHLTSDGENTESVISRLMEFLHIEHVSIDYDYSNED